MLVGMVKSHGVGLREHTQETPIFDGKNHGVQESFP